jgi:oxygen-independent coproporphyrinogen-3 oxidase
VRELPLSIYVHWPWCVKKCPYCDFNSHEIRQTIPEEAYVQSWLKDINQALPEIWGRPIQSIFFGGGTPSLISPELLAVFLEQLRAMLPWVPDIEITLEANPGTWERERFAAYGQAGVNRLSLGIQSFSESHLKVLGRIHDGKEARQALEQALNCFERVNVDLMYGLPEQTLEQALSDVRVAIGAGVTHLSAYQLTIEPHTAWGSKPPPLPGSDQVADMGELIAQLLSEAGLQRYEISAYAKRGETSRHNLNYWTFGDYLGIGAGAHSKLTGLTGVLRQQRYSHPNAYMKSAGEAYQERKNVSQSELPFEFLLNVLRLTKGVSTELFSERTGLPLAVLEDPWFRAQERGLLPPLKDRIIATELGRRFLNDTVVLFLPDD